MVLFAVVALLVAVVAYDLAQRQHAILRTFPISGGGSTPILAISRACGVPHPALASADHLELLNDALGARTLAESFGYARGVGLPSPADDAAIRELMPV